MSGAAFSTRLQMYPRVEQLWVIVFLMVECLVFAAADNGPGTAVFSSLFAGYSMWVAVPDDMRYRSFGIPVRYWLVDTVTAVAGVGVLTVGAAVLLGGGVWAHVGILAATVVVGVRLWTGRRAVLRGDVRVLSMEQRGGRWSARWAGGLPGSAGPLPWRLVYFPTLMVTVSTAVIAGATFFVVAGLLTSDGGEVELVMLLPLVAVGCQATGGAMGSGYRAWTVLGVPVRRWLWHAYAASALVLVAAASFLWCAASLGYVDTSTMFIDRGAARVALFLAFAALFVAVLVVIVTSSAYFTFLISIVPAIGLVVTPSVTDRATPVLVGVGLVVLALTAFTVVATVRKATSGNHLRPVGFAQGAERTYYQREGAL